MSTSDPPLSVVVIAVRDDGYIASKHRLGGKQVQKDLAQGDEVHVFEDTVDLKDLENKVWREGVYQGKIGARHRREFDRFVWRSPFPIGRRIQRGRADVWLPWVEIKGKINKGRWLYHLVPRPRPAR